MSYEKTAVAETSTAIPSQPQNQMREAREVNPYAHVTRLDKAKAAATISQSNISSEPAEPVKTEETVTLSPQMAALARKEQKFRQQELAVKAEKEALVKERAEIAELKAMKEALATGDYSKLDGIVPYEKFTQWKIDQNSNVTPEQQAINEVKTELEELKKAQQDDVSKRFEAAVNERRTAVKTLVDSNAEFASIKKLNMQEAVVQHILDTWSEDSVELSPEQAAKEVSELLKEKAKSWASILEEQPAAQPVEDKKQLPPLKSGIKTLTNQMTVQGEIKRPVKSFQGMSDNERYAEARRRAEEKLKLQQRG